ncbi:MAG: 3-isopropylmalate dehydratase [Chloroflexi bacterium]|nr:3-isopropylmalate dehydratase [Chloroflexota bacterium]
MILHGRVWKYGDDVNTDVIFPGKYTYTVTDPKEQAKHALEDLDPTFASNVQSGAIIVGGKNWGNGSSREQAVGCLKYSGVTAIIAKSFGRIYFRNVVNNGLVPIVSAPAVDAIQNGETIDIDLDAHTIRCVAGSFDFPALSPSLLTIIETGGLIQMLRKKLGTEHLPMPEIKSGGD